MVRAVIDFNEADYERIRRAADERGVTIERFIADEAVRAVPEPTPASEGQFETWQEFFDWIDSLKLKPSGWKWNREELYDRKVFR